MKTYRYDSATKEYLFSDTAFLDPLETEMQGKDVYLLPADSTFTEAPEKKEGYAILWNGASWDVVEDHRKKPGVEDSGTPYWLPGDTWRTPARYMTELGPLPEGALIEAPQPTEEELLAQAKSLKIAEIDRAMSEIDAKLARSSSDIVAAMLAPATTDGEADGATSLSAEELEQSKAVFAALRSLQTQNRALRAQVQTAQSVEQVQAAEPVIPDMAALAAGE